MSAPSGLGQLRRSPLVHSCSPNLGNQNIQSLKKNKKIFETPHGAVYVGLDIREQNVLIWATLLKQKKKKNKEI